MALFMTKSVTLPPPLMVMSAPPVRPSMVRVSASVSEDCSAMVPLASVEAKVIVSPAVAAAMTVRSDPEPLSFRLVTTSVVMVQPFSIGGPLERDRCRRNRRKRESRDQTKS